MILFQDLLAIPTLNYLKVKTKKKQLNPPISGINRIENQETIPFIKKNELILITGNCLNQHLPLFDLLESIFNSQTISVVILNVGPHINAINEDLIELADNNQVPLLEMPWNIRVADITQTISEVIYESKKLKIDEARFIKNLSQSTFHSELMTVEIAQKLQIEDFDTFSVLIISSKQSHSPRLVDYFEKLQELISVTFPCSITHIKLDKMTVILNEKNGYLSEVNTLISKIPTITETFPNLTVSLGKGTGYELTNLHKSYNEALLTLAATLSPNKKSVEYADLAIHKLLITLDKQLLKTIYHDTLGPLLEYDRMNEQEYLTFLRVFIEENGRINTIAKRMFLHRNTVQYRIDRIGTILDINLKSFYDISTVTIAFCIEDLLGF